MSGVYIVAMFLICGICAVAGIGGGVIIKPLFDAISPFSSTVISTISLFAVLSMALSGVIQHVHMRTILRWDRAIRIAVGAMLGGIAGQRLFYLSKDLPDNIVKLVQNIILLVLLILVLVCTLKRAPLEAGKRNPPVLVELVAVFCTGSVSAFVGIGGGPVNVCLVCLMYGIRIKEAAIYSLVMIVFSQTAKLSACILDGTLFSIEMDTWCLVIGISLAGVTGGAIGAYLSKGMDNKNVDRFYLAVLVFIIAIILYNILNYWH